MSTEDAGIRMCLAHSQVHDEAGSVDILVWVGFEPKRPFGTNPCLIVVRRINPSHLGTVCIHLIEPSANRIIGSSAKKLEFSSTPLSIVCHAHFQHEGVPVLETVGNGEMQ
jgi:hypothetical protein